MRTLAFAILALMCLATSPRQGEPPATITIRVLLPDGSAAKGVNVGRSTSRPDTPTAEHPCDISTFDGGTDTTDDRGEYHVERKFLFDETSTRPRAVVALSKDRSLMGLGQITVEMANAGEPAVVRLAPVCRVTARVTSTELAGLGRTFAVSHVYVWCGKLRPTGSEGSKDGVHHILLPPGEYSLFAYGTDSGNKNLSITIAPGEREKQVELDVPASRVARLIGKDAPELRAIKAWKNGGPVTLASLKGKVVLLDFWGSWCGPCIGAMPELMELHEKYKDQGLVIIAVHDDSTESIATMDAALVEVKQKFWGGKDLPFLIALDGGGEVPIPGEEETARGLTTAEYGISAFPTQVLIGRDGKVVGRRKRGEPDPVPGLLEKK
jgi:thiol-disulfide isomerase/thioredoxin